MSVFSKIKETFLFKNKTESPEITLYKECVAANFVDIQRYRKYTEDASHKVYEYRISGYTNKNELFREALENFHRFNYALYEAEKITDFIRPNTPEDIEYRNSWQSQFSKRLKEILPENSNLRFHGTPIYFAKEIIKSGGISSSADRFNGYIKSTDNKGEISVSDINGLSRTINYYLDLDSYQRCLPAGCLFVLIGDGQTETQKNRSTMYNVDFKRTPEKLLSIITTPENIPNVKEWLVEANLSKELVCSFEDFIENIEKKFTRQAIFKSSLNEKISAADTTRANINKEIKTPAVNMIR